MKKNYYLWILLIIVQVFVIQNTYAQQGMITGIVKDVNGEPIIWCQCKGTGHNSRYNYGFGRKVFCESIFWCGSAGILHWLCDGKDSGG